MRLGGLRTGIATALEQADDERGADQKPPGNLTEESPRRDPPPPRLAREGRSNQDAWQSPFAPLYSSSFGIISECNPSVNRDR